MPTVNGITVAVFTTMETGVRVPHLYGTKLGSADVDLWGNSLPISGCAHNDAICKLGPFQEAKSLGLQSHSNQRDVGTRH